MAPLIWSDTNITRSSPARLEVDQPAVLQVEPVETVNRRIATVHARQVHAAVTSRLVRADGLDPASPVRGPVIGVEVRLVGRDRQGRHVLGWRARLGRALV